MDADKSVELFNERLSKIRKLNRETFNERLSKVRKLNRETREWLNEQGFPWGYRGRLVPSPRIKEFQERLAQYNARDSEENKSPRGQTQEEE